MKRSILAMLGLGALLAGSVALTAPAAQAQVNCTGVAAWSPNSVSYAVGALVTYNGSEYKCLQAHTSQAGWDPADVPALWSDVGTCSTTTGTTTGSTTGTCSASPSAPTGLSASGTTTTSTNLSWTAVTPPSNCTISSYTIYKGGTSIGTSTSTSFAVTGLTASTTYAFTVAATDAHGTGSQSSALSVTTSSASCAASPSAPTGLSASGTTSTSTNLSWTAVTPPANCSISSYTIYKGGTSIGTSTSTSFAVTGLTASTTYAFTVAATDAHGTGSQSSALSVTTTAAASCSTSPGAPTGLAASGTTSTGTNLSWGAVTPPANCSISSYTIYKGGTSIGTSTSTSFAVTGLTASTTYSFTVAATDAHGTGSQSSALSVTTSSGGTLPACYTAWNSTTAYSGGANVSYAGVNYTAAFYSQGSEPDKNSGPTGSGQPWVSDGACNTGQNCTTIAAVPSGLAASNTSSNTTSLSWNAVSPPTSCLISGYAIYENGTLVATVSSGTSYLVSGLAASTTYKFTIASVDGAGTSAQSASISVTTGAQGSSASSKMIGYWESWGSTTLATVANNYDVVEVAFAVEGGTDGSTISMPQMTETTNQVQADIATLHGQGKKVVLSVGGANAYSFKIQSSADESAFVSSIESIFSQFAFDGIDLDIENGLLNQNAGDNDINNPTTPSTVYLIQAMEALNSHFGSGFIYTMAPQTSDIDAMGHWGTNSGIGWGDFIPLINKTRNVLTYCMTQDYNSGQEYGLDMAVYTEGTVDFNVAMEDLLLHGYTTAAPSSQSFPALGQSQVVMGVPAVSAAAGSGYLAPASVLASIKYLMRGTGDGGSYTLKGGPYPSMGGVMTWDCNYDYNAGYPMASALDSYLHSH